MAKLLRAAVIGCGRIARDKHLPAFAFHAGKVEAVGFCDAYLPAAQSLAAEYGVSDSLVTHNPADIFAKDDIDLVHICTPNSTHGALAIAAMEAGKHVMCEKPMAHTAAVAKEMWDVSRATGRLLSISCQNRFRKDSLAVHRYCESGELGELYYAKAYALRRKGVPAWGMFTSQAAQGGGALIDIGTHALDLALWHLGDYDVRSVSAVCFHHMKDHPEGNLLGEWDPASFDVEDSVFGLVRMQSGRALYLQAAWAIHAPRPQEAVAAVYGTLGGATQYVQRHENGSADYQYRIDTLRHGELVTITPDYAEMNRFSSGKSQNEVLVEAPRREMDCWLSAVAQDAAPVVTAEQGYVVCRVIEAFYRSAQAGREVVLED